MMSFLTTLVSALVLACSVIGAPLDGALHSLETRQSAQAAPHWVLYSDAWVTGENGPPSPSVISGFNVFILSFLLTTGPADQVLEWTYLDNATRASIKSEYEAAGIKLMISAFGSTDAPTTNGYDAVALANQMAAFVIEWGLDGIDIDYEDFTAMNLQNGQAEYWLISFTETLRSRLPAGQYIITHAPVAPWFSAPKYPTGAYVIVNSNAGYAIDWYNVQFYNQGAAEYANCTTLITESTTTWPYTSIFELNSIGGVPLNKLVIGKPANTNDASNGYMATSMLATCVEQAKNMGWSAGVMTWEYPDAAASWITAVRADSYPV